MIRDGRELTPTGKGNDGDNSACLGARNVPARDCSVATSVRAMCADGQFLASVTVSYSQSEILT